MLEEKIFLDDNTKFKKGNLKFAVIGHIEWVNFLELDNLPEPGIISHSKNSLELPAGGGTVIAKTLRELTNNEVHFFTSLGEDYYGIESFKYLEEIGIRVHVAWRNMPTRKGISIVDKRAERSITIIGDRLEPNYFDKLDWNILEKMDGIFITAGDEKLFKISREAKALCSTPRAGIKIINNSGVLLDGLIGSNIDPGESYFSKDLEIKPRFIIKTEGEKGGLIIPGGRFNAFINKSPKIDSYGCGDSFAAGILYGLASNWSIEKTIN